MGHSVNPIAIRLSAGRDWVDSFSNQSKFYPEVLHSTLYVRRLTDQFFIQPYFYTRDMLIVIVL